LLGSLDSIQPSKPAFLKLCIATPWGGGKKLKKTGKKQLKIPIFKEHV
jgi:hypothetical protein